MGIQARHHQMGCGRKAPAKVHQGIEFAPNQRLVEGLGYGGQRDMAGGEQGVQAPAAVGGLGGEQH